MPSQQSQVSMMSTAAGVCRRARVMRAAIPLLAALTSTRGLPAQGEKSPPRLVGVVRDSLGTPVVGAQLIGPTITVRAVTGPDGRYVMTNVVGLVQIDVRRLGFRPRSIEARVAASGTTTLDIVLIALPTSLPTVVIRDHHEASDSRLAGFNERRAQRVGHFITRDQIERERVYGLIDLLRNEPSVRVTTLRGGRGRSIVLRGMNCPPLVVVDGFPASAGPFDLDMIDLSSVEGIEIYSSAASVPSELMGPRGLEQCGVIAIWSRPFTPRTVPQRAEDKEAVVPIQPLIEQHEVFTADQVDQVAKYRQGSATPDYPDSLWSERRTGRVVAEFVVDTTGRVVLPTVSIVSATAVTFGESVRKALASARFESATLRNRRVPQVVRMTFQFESPPLAPQTD